MNIADFIFNLDTPENIFNGHYQTELASIKFEDFQTLVCDLYKHPSNKHTLFLEIYEASNKKGQDSYSVTIYQKDFWEKNPYKDTPTIKDRMIISIDCIHFSKQSSFKKDMAKFLAENSDFIAFTFS